MDAMFDFFNDLSAGVRGALGRSEVAEVNGGLRERFARFWLDTTAEGVHITPELHPDSAAVLVADSPEGKRPATSDPKAWAAFYERHPTCVARLVSFEGEGEPFPVLVGPEQYERDSQESWHSSR